MIGLNQTYEPKLHELAPPPPSPQASNVRAEPTSTNNVADARAFPMRRQR